MRFLKQCRGIALQVFLFGSVVFINLFQCMSLIIKPFSPKLFRKFNRFCADRWWWACAVATEDIVGINIHFSGDDVPEKENAVVICNHQGMSDIPVLFTLARRKKSLGDMKWFVKDVMKYIPGIGWGMLFLDCLFVKRNWFKDKDLVTKTFSKINSENIPIWLMNFPEGTRLTPEKLKKANEFAESRGHGTFENVMLPRTKGVAASISGLKGHVNSLYDVSIYYPENAPTLNDFFFGKVMDIHVRVDRFNLATIPQDENGISNWLIDRFKVKDRWLTDKRAMTSTL